MEIQPLGIHSLRERFLESSYICGRGGQVGLVRLLLRGHSPLELLHRFPSHFGQEVSKLSLETIPPRLPDQGENSLAAGLPVGVLVIDEKQGVGEHLEHPFVNPLVDDCIVGIFRGGVHTIHKELLVVALHDLLGLASRLHPILGDHPPEHSLGPVDSQLRLDPVIQTMERLVGLRVDGLQVEVGPVLSLVVLPEKQPGEAVKDGGLPGAILSLDAGISPVELEDSIAHTLEVVQGYSVNTDVHFSAPSSRLS